jgi:putative multiple sugar transport system substrate-binding protein
MVLSLSLGACGSSGDDSSASSGDKIKVGVSMPTKSLQRWNQDGDNMKKELEEAGYEVDLQYAGDNDVQKQVEQLDNMISGGCKILVIAAVDAETLGTPLADAKAEGIPVIAYDRLIMNSDAVTYYATFDNTKVGNLQGQAIVDALDLDNQAGPFNIEFFTGDPGDNNINFFFGGALDVLQPYIDSGKLVTPSGQTEKAQAATEGWNTEKSQARMDNLISQYYSGKKLDAVLSSNDSVALGIENALEGASYKAGADWPVITGQDCDVANVKNMLKGLQTMSVFKDTRTLASQVVKMIDAILQGGEPEINDTTTYANDKAGKNFIPSYLCDPEACTIDNYQEILIDSGYYTEDELE